MQCYLVSDLGLAILDLVCSSFRCVFGSSGSDLVHNALACKILIQMGLCYLLVGLEFCTMASSNLGVVSSSSTAIVPVIIHESIPSFSSITAITTDKLNGKNYMSWSASIRMWFRGHDVSNYLTVKISDIAKTDRTVWDRIDAQLVTLL